jgi:hypothetical protein
MTARIVIAKCDASADSGFIREIRVENVLTDENGEKVRLKLGADIDVVVEADTDATTTADQCRPPPQ